MTSADILIAARARLTPETWGKGHDIRAPTGGRECILVAIGKVASVEERPDTWVLLAECATGNRYADIGGWNDAPERTLADVHALFDAAIAIAQQREVSAAVPA